MKKMFLTGFNFGLFDGTADGPQGGSTAGQQADDAGKSGGVNAVYENQNENSEPVAGANAEEAEENPSPRDLRAKYDEFMKDRAMREFANADTQKIINRRFRETKSLQERLTQQEGVMERLRQRYGDLPADELEKAIDNDSAIWEEAALNAGLSVEQFRHQREMEMKLKRQAEFFENLERQRKSQEQYDRWTKEAEEIKLLYPDFDLEKELQNADFAGLIGQKNPQYAISMRQAYEICHMDEIMNGIRQKTADETEKRVVDNVKSRGTRPAEGAVSQQSGVVVKTDVSKLTKADREEITRRVMRGELITF